MVTYVTRILNITFCENFLHAHFIRIYLNLLFNNQSIIKMLLSCRTGFHFCLDTKTKQKSQENFILPPTCHRRPGPNFRARALLILLKFYTVLLIYISIFTGSIELLTPGIHVSFDLIFRNLFIHNYFYFRQFNRICVYGK